MERNPFFKKFESKESKELFRATLGFDFIFTLDAEGNKKIMCVEFNGETSGIAGMREIPGEELGHQQKILSDIRGTKAPEFRRKHALGTEIVDTMRNNTFQASSPNVTVEILNYLRDSHNRAPMFTHALENPPEIEKLTQNKQTQQAYIPEEYKPMTFDETAEHRQKSASGYWILKPISSRGGEGVHLATEEELDEVMANKEKWFRPYLIQEFLPPTGAEKVPEELKGHAASMRFLLDFTYSEDGTITPMYQTGYQRVSPVDGTNRLGKFDMEEAFVVNRNREALSFPASEHELALAREAALAIISNVGAAYKNGELAEKEQEQTLENPQTGTR
jgi:hypothetical protein